MNDKIARGSKVHKHISFVIFSLKILSVVFKHDSFLAGRQTAAIIIDAMVFYEKASTNMLKKNFLLGFEAMTLSVTSAKEILSLIFISNKPDISYFTK